MSSFVLFTYKIKSKYFLEFENRKSSDHFVDCLRYCNNINSDEKLFRHVKVKNGDANLVGLLKCPSFYKSNVYRWVTRGYV